VKERNEIAAYLVQLNRGLTVGLARRKRILAEVEQHLRDAADAASATGLDRAEAEQRAVAAFGSPEVVAERFAPDAAGRAEAALSRMLSALDLITLRHPWRGAALRAALGLFPFAVLFVVSGVSSNEWPGGLMATAAVAAGAWFVANGYRYRAVRNRTEAGLRARLCALSRERPLLHKAAVTSVAWVLIGSHLVRSSRLGRDLLLLGVILLLVNSSRIRTWAVARRSSRPGRRWGVFLGTTRSGDRLFRWVRAALFIAGLALLAWERDRGMVTLLGAGGGAMVFFVGPRLLSRRAATTENERLGTSFLDHPFRAASVFGLPVLVIPVIAAFGAGVPLSFAIEFGIMTLVVGTVVIVGFGVLLRVSARRQIDSNLEARVRNDDAVTDAESDPSTASSPRPAAEGS
jgi:hypothetical protein